MTWRNAVLTLPEAARELRRHPELIRQWLNVGRIRGEKVGGRWFVTRGELKRFRQAEPERRRGRER